ncbi:ISP domain-containing protein [Dacryopinax primogenitus]|uniref:Choline monooxygenase, chloroplastic n=1 Tax=Dacryopinax primogenitus (strain DJM 731) TaxID=1858805 RepID=M5G4Z4_DACPD|nr:ISP domain-containing protein [Dacryopinax primogenitus]EJU03295.1 ISP domain-containing protein [Dacryopinax primogenitus]
MDIYMESESPEDVENGGQRLTPLRPVDNPATATPAFHENVGRGFSQLVHRSLTPAETLPSQWYRDDRIHHLERKAIFSKSWILVTHVSRFSKEGDYVAFEIANFPFFVIRTRDGRHNVCRHRGFPLVSKMSGCSPVISCGYHGWCYSPQDGRLVRSTHSSFPSFDASKYSLFKIHTHVISSGFIFVNLSAQEPPPFRDWFGDLEQEWGNLRSDDYEYAYSWYECVHCHTSHPGYAASLDLSTYAVETKTKYALHITALKPGREEAQSTLASGAESEGAPSFAYVFPSNAVTVTNMMWYMMRVVPISATQTRMEYDVFKHKSITLERLRAYMQFYEKVEDEDFHLVSATQKSLNTGIYRRGSLHPTKEVERGPPQRKSPTDNP